MEAVTQKMFLELKIKKCHVEIEELEACIV